MTYHRAAAAHAKDATSAAGVHTGHLHCHYCLAASPLPDKCPACGKPHTLSVPRGTEKDLLVELAPGPEPEQGGGG